MSGRELLRKVGPARYYRYTGTKPKRANTVGSWGFVDVYGIRARREAMRVSEPSAL